MISSDDDSLLPLSFDLQVFVPEPVPRNSGTHLVLTSPRTSDDVDDDEDDDDDDEEDDEEDDDDSGLDRFLFLPHLGQRSCLFFDMGVPLLYILFTISYVIIVKMVWTRLKFFM